MRQRQIRRLIDVIAQPNVDVRILPTDAGLHSGLAYDDRESLEILHTFARQFGG